MRIELRRSGGFAGLTRRVELDTAVLTEQQAAELEQLVEAAQLDQLPVAPAPAARGADRFQYDLVVRTDGAHHDVRVREGQVPPPLRRLIDRLLELGAP